MGVQQGGLVYREATDPFKGLQDELDGIRSAVQSEASFTPEDKAALLQELDSKSQELLPQMDLGSIAGRVTDSVGNTIDNLAGMAGEAFQGAARGIAEGVGQVSTHPDTTLAAVADAAPAVLRGVADATSVPLNMLRVPLDAYAGAAGAAGETLGNLIAGKPADFEAALRSRINPQGLAAWGNLTKGVEDLGKGVANTALAAGTILTGRPQGELTGTDISPDVLKLMQQYPETALAQFTPDVALGLGFGSLGEGFRAATLPQKLRGVARVAAVEGGIQGARGTGEGGGTLGDRIIGGAAGATLGAGIEAALASRTATRLRKPYTLTGINKAKEADTAATLDELMRRPVQASPAATPVTNPARLLAPTDPVTSAANTAKPQLRNIGEPGVQVTLAPKSAQDSAKVFKAQAQKQQTLRASKEKAQQRAQGHFDKIVEKTGINPVQNPQGVVSKYMEMMNTPGQKTKGQQLRNSLVQLRKETRRQKDLQQNLMQSGRLTKRTGPAFVQAQKQSAAQYTANVLQQGGQGRMFVAGPNGVRVNPSVAEANLEAAMQLQKQQRIIEDTADLSKPTPLEKSAVAEALDTLQDASRFVEETAPEALGGKQTLVDLVLKNQSKGQARQEFGALRSLRQNFAGAGFGKTLFNTQSSGVDFSGGTNATKVLARAEEEGRTLKMRAQQKAIEQEASFDRYLDDAGHGAHTASVKDGGYALYRKEQELGLPTTASPDEVAAYKAVDSYLAENNTAGDILQSLGIKTSDPLKVSAAMSGTHVAVVDTRQLTAEQAQRLMDAHPKMAPFGNGHVYLEFGNGREDILANILEGRRYYDTVAPGVLAGDDFSSAVSVIENPLRKASDLTVVSRNVDELVSGVEQDLRALGIDQADIDKMRSALQKESSSIQGGVVDAAAVYRAFDGSMNISKGQKVGLGVSVDPVKNRTEQALRLSRVAERKTVTQALGLARRMIDEAPPTNNFYINWQRAAEKEALDSLADRAMGRMGLEERAFAAFIDELRGNGKLKDVAADVWNGLYHMKIAADMGGSMSSVMAQGAEFVAMLADAGITNADAIVKGVFENPNVLNPARIKQAMKASPYAAAYNADFEAVAGSGRQLAQPGPVSKATGGVAKAALLGHKALHEITMYTSYAMAEAAGKARGLAGRELDDYIFDQMNYYGITSRGGRLFGQDAKIGRQTWYLMSWLPNLVMRRADSYSTVFSGAHRATTGNNLLQRAGAAAFLTTPALLYGAGATPEGALLNYLYTNVTGDDYLAQERADNTFIGTGLAGRIGVSGENAQLGLSQGAGKNINRSFEQLGGVVPPEVGNILGIAAGPQVDLLAGAGAAVVNSTSPENAGERLMNLSTMLANWNRAARYARAEKNNGVGMITNRNGNSVVVIDDTPTTSEMLSIGLGIMPTQYQQNNAYEQSLRSAEGSTGTFKQNLLKEIAKSSAATAYDYPQKADELRNAVIELTVAAQQSLDIDPTSNDPVVTFDTTLQSLREPSVAKAEEAAIKQQSSDTIAVKRLRQPRLYGDLTNKYAGQPSERVRLRQAR